MKMRGLSILLLFAILSALAGCGAALGTDGAGYMSERVKLKFIPDLVTFRQYRTFLLESPEYLYKFWNSVFLVLPTVLLQVALAAESDSYGETLRLYMSLSYAARMGLDVSITSYEAVLPEVVSGFGADAIQTALALDDKLVELKTITDRFTLRAGLRSAGDLAYRAQRESAIEYPWWENHAAVFESKNAL